jgi:hypothetical protein
MYSLWLKPLFYRTHLDANIIDMKIYFVHSRLYIRFYHILHLQLCLLPYIFNKHWPVHWDIYSVAWQLVFSLTRHEIRFWEALSNSKLENLYHWNERWYVMCPALDCPKMSTRAESLCQYSRLFLARLISYCIS